MERQNIGQAGGVELGSDASGLLMCGGFEGVYVGLTLGGEEGGSDPAGTRL